MKRRSQYQERSEDEMSESMRTLMQDTNNAPILLNQGSMIFKVSSVSVLLSLQVVLR